MKLFNGKPWTFLTFDFILTFLIFSLISCSLQRQQQICTFYDKNAFPWAECLTVKFIIFNNSNKKKSNLKSYFTTLEFTDL